LTALLEKPHLQGWYGRVKQRPSFAKAMEKWVTPQEVELMRDKGAVNRERVLEFLRTA
jgi:hypothetical protein